MKKITKYNNDYKLNRATILSFIIYSILLVGLFLIIRNCYYTPVEDGGVFPSVVFKIMALCGFGFCFFLLFAGLIGILTGIIKGKLKILKENIYAKSTNPYIYYRELPNNFGIGIATLLIDSRIENYKDIVAVILDLCAKKYLYLTKQNDKYVIKVLKGIDSNLLSNEKYILSLIIYNDIKNINYQEWYNYCMQDGINLGLYSHIERNKNSFFQKPLFKTNGKEIKKSHILIFSLLILVFVSSVLEGNIFIAFMNVMILLFASYVIFIVFSYIKAVISVISMAMKVHDFNYKNTLENHLEKTKMGIEEVHKLYSLKKFLNDFGYFVDKKPEEVLLWDRYLAYAQVFGLTKEIMRSGYKELIDNSSFQIDNINNITLNNIELENSEQIFNDI